jgi:DNA-binding LacI/PurR family transcriptional regulator
MSGRGNDLMAVELGHHVVGLVVRRSQRQLAAEPFYADMVAGLDSVLQPAGTHLILRIVPTLDAELAEYARWGENHAVTAFVMVDVLPEDPRPELLQQLGMPGIVFGSADPAWGIPTVGADGYGQMRELVEILVSMGHTRLGRVGGRAELLHTQERARGFHDAVFDLGVVGSGADADYTAEGGAEATRVLLGAAEPPSAIVYDNDAMAVGALGLAQELGVNVPDELSVVAWDDSAQCRLAPTPISAMNHDVHGMGVLAANVLLEVLRGGHPKSAITKPPVWVPRSTVAANRMLVR